MKHIDIVFEGNMPNALFVEVEDDTGKSIALGEWLQRPDGHWALRLNAFAVAEMLADGREESKRE
jgi:hypothetical protein